MHTSHTTEHHRATKETAMPKPQRATKETVMTKDEQTTKEIGMPRPQRAAKETTTMTKEQTTKEIAMPKQHAISEETAETKQQAKNATLKRGENQLCNLVSKASPIKSNQHQDITHALVMFRGFFHERKIVPTSNIKDFKTEFNPAAEYLVKDSAQGDHGEQEESVSSSEEDSELYPAQILKLGTKDSLSQWVDSTAKNRIVVPPVRERIEVPPSKKSAQKRDAEKLVQHSPNKTPKLDKIATKKIIKAKILAKKSSIENNMKTVLEQKKSEQFQATQDKQKKRNDDHETSAKFGSVTMEFLKSENAVLKLEVKSLKDQLAMAKDSIFAHKLNSENMQELVAELKNTIKELKGPTQKGFDLYKRKSPSSAAAASDSDSKSTVLSSSAYYTQSEPSTSKSNVHSECKLPTEYINNAAVRHAGKISENKFDTFSYEPEVADVFTDEIKNSSDEEQSDPAYSSTKKVLPMQNSVRIHSSDVKSSKRNVSVDEKRDAEEWFTSKYPNKFTSASMSEPKLLSRTSDKKVYFGYGLYMEQKQWAQVKKSSTHRKLVGTLTIALLGKNAHDYNKTGYKGNARNKEAKGKEKKEFPPSVVAIVRDMLWRYLMRKHDENGDVVNAILKSIDYLSIMSDAARDRDPKRVQARAIAHQKRQEKKKEEKLKVHESEEDSDDEDEADSDTLLIDE